ncbi:MAG: O-antigen ligase family protein [Bacillota bacterium]|nr:O-antigen ligase family protein [Bacillota bacterium]
MSSFKVVRRNGIALFDYLLILGLVLAPMTELRVWKIGPSELLCMLWSTKYIRGFFEGGLKNYLIRFWLLFYLTVTAGMLYCLIFYPRESSGVDGLFTWFFMLYISLGVYAGMKKHSLRGILSILETVVVLSAVWYLFLLVYSRVVSPYFFGARLWYARVRYTGGGRNPHQMAILSLGMMFVSFYFLCRVKLSLPKKLLHAACMLAHLYYLFLTRSTTAWMAMAAAYAVGAVLLFLLLKRSVRNRQITVILLAGFSLLVVMVAFTQLYQKFYNWVAKDPNGLHRFQLFAYVLDPLRKNFLFGLGDGTHSNDGISEFHNTYLEIIGMSGLIGVIIFVLFTYRMIKKLWHDPFLLILPFAYYVYGFAGFGMRRLPYWVLSVIMMAMAEKIPIQEGLRFKERRLSRAWSPEGLLYE